MRDFFASMTRHPVGLLGCAITTVSAVLILTLWAMNLTADHGGGPYTGILSFLVLPAIFFVGLLLIPIGVRLARRRARRLAASGGAEIPAFPILDLNRATTRRRVLIFLVLTAVNVVVLATATYKGVEVMESDAFCGTTCHNVMQPEHTAYQRSPHSRVGCVSCHIGPGADWFVKSKLSGAWQVVSVTFDLYPRPIPTPVHSLRPARETCEQCHWPTKFVGDRLDVRTHYAEDEANTELKSVLLLKVGGLQGRASHGIHWHVDPDVRIRYRADESRETIQEVELTTGDGTPRLYQIPNAPEGEGEWREMDCVDCHNRPSHIYRMPADEVDVAMQEGKLAREIPWLRREAVRLLQQPYDSHAAARAGLASDLVAYYRENHPEVVQAQAAALEQAGRTLGDIYASNVFPGMNVQWGTYPDHIGHSHSPGCFRCHDGEHVTDDGTSISQDCSTCHTLLALDEENPAILQSLQP